MTVSPRINVLLSHRHSHPRPGCERYGENLSRPQICSATLGAKCRLGEGRGPGGLLQEFALIPRLRPQSLDVGSGILTGEEQGKAGAPE